MRSAWRGLAIVGLALMALFVVAACGGSDSKEKQQTRRLSSSGTPEIGVDRFDGGLLCDGQAQTPCEQGQRNDRGSAAGHDDVGALRPVRRAEPEEGLQGRGALFRPVQGRERTGQHQHHAAAGRSRHHRRRLGAPHRSTRPRIGSCHRGERSVEGREGDRLRPPHDRGPRGSVLRQLQQRGGRAS